MSESLLCPEVVEKYAASVRGKRSDPNHHPETSLYTPLELLLQSVADASLTGATISAQSSTRQSGVPDFAVLDRFGAPFAWVEAKAPEANLEALRGDDRKQFERYMELPCVLYTNFHELVLYVEGERVAASRLVDFAALDPETRKRRPLPDLGPAMEVFERLLTFEPPPMKEPSDIARALARRARIVKGVVADVLAAGASDPLHEIFNEFEGVLFYQLAPEQFAHAYAQTLAYGLLLSRTLSRDTRLEAATAHKALEGDHKMLSSALRLLTQPEVTALIGWSVEALVATVRNVDPGVLEKKSGEDAVVYFYEHFLAEYDPALRKQVGAYFTPIEVVEFQVRAADELLASDLELEEGIGSSDVDLLDPAAGTATYPLAIMRRVIAKVTETSGSAAVPGALRALAERVFGFELLVAAYAVGRWRLATLLDERKATGARPRMVLTDTLIQATEGGKEVPTRFGFMGKAITDEGKEADRIKSKQPIMVILGNPPYGRTNLRADDDPGSEDWRWKWIWGKVDDFKKGVPDEERVNLKNLANRYILFWRWAFWKLLDAEAHGPGRGIVTFISDRSFLEGGWAAGMRAYMRENFQRVLIVDIRGDARAPKLAGAERDENVFAIETPVAITICVRTGEDKACNVEYLRLRGTEAAKRAELKKLLVRDHRFRAVGGEAGDSFVPQGDEQFLSWPSIASLFVEYFSGIQTKRDELVVAVRTALLRGNFRRLQTTPGDFHETRDKKLPNLAAFRFDVEMIADYGYRPLDRRFLYLDDHFVEYSRSKLRECWGGKNRAFATLARKHGSGPVAFASGVIPDLHSFRGSYGGHVFLLWDDRKRHGRKRTHNLRPELLDALAGAYGESPNAEEVFDYIYGLLQAPAYGERFHEELQQSFPRVPFPASRELFDKLARRGEFLLSLHCFEVTPKRGENQSRLEGEEARIDEVEFDEVAGRVALSDGVALTNVTASMWGFEVSGYPVLRRWLEARRGFELSVDEVRELLAVVYAIRKTVELARDLDALLSQVIDAPQIDLSKLAANEVMGGDDQ